MQIDMNRRIVGGIPDFTALNPNYDPHWADIPRHQSRFDGKEIEVKVLFAYSQWSDKPDKNNVLREKLSLELFYPEVGTRIACNLTGDGKDAETGQPVECMFSSCLNYGQLAQHMSPKAFEGVQFVNFGHPALAYPFMVGMPFKLAIYTNKIVVSRAGNPVFYNQIEFFHEATRKTYLELIENKPASRIDEVLAEMKEKFEADQRKAQAAYGALNSQQAYGALNAEPVKPSDVEIPF